MKRNHYSSSEDSDHGSEETDIFEYSTDGILREGSLTSSGEDKPERPKYYPEKEEKTFEQEEDKPKKKKICLETTPPYVRDFSPMAPHGNLIPPVEPPRYPEDMPGYEFAAAGFNDLGIRSSSLDDDFWIDLPEEEREEFEKKHKEAWVKYKRDRANYKRRIQEMQNEQGAGAGPGGQGEENHAADGAAGGHGEENHAADAGAEGVDVENAAGGEAAGGEAADEDGEDWRF